MAKLRELAKKDIPIINQWRNDPALIACLGAPFRYINEDVDYKWYESYMGNRNKAVRCAIIDKEDIILGIVSLTDIDYMNQSAELSIMIGSVDNRDKGIGSYAVRAMVEHGFYNMNLHRISVTALESNKRACHVYEKIGFKKEGVLRDVRFKNGEFVTMVQYAILRNEYISRGGGRPDTSNLPVFSLEQIWDFNKKNSIMRECDTAFQKPLFESDSYPALVEKIHLCGLFYCASNNHVLGYAVVYANDYKCRFAYLTLIVVKTKVHQKGIGKKLLEQCETVAYQNGMEKIKLEVNKSNTNAIEFYRYMGYGFCSEASENSIYMIKKIHGGTKYGEDKCAYLSC